MKTLLDISLPGRRNNVKKDENIQLTCPGKDTDIKKRAVEVSAFHHCLLPPEI